ncbi:MAG: Uncharacterised protein [Formosa sp. Hel1_33_131]|jgi:copper chaperone CopZ|nr:MAG: Uncharacterised protein [Formosa sp. Hel1_33_131]|tara:strand:- start:1136 stop:1564 length:429 start_codon:yes stop_codon:yes gene_type:complete
MKKVILSLAVIATIGLLSYKKTVKNETATVSNEMQMMTLSFGVRGNCGMCKNTIEKTANKVEGDANATWDVDQKKVDVSFDAAKTNEMEIHNAIAASGYDTDKVASDLNAYGNLPMCCQYDHEMELNNSDEILEEDPSNHNH